MLSCINELVSNASSQLISDNKLSSFIKLFPEATEFGWAMGKCCFANIPPLDLQRCYRKNSCFLINKNAKSSDFYYRELKFLPFHYNFVETNNTLIQKRQSSTEICIEDSPCKCSCIFCTDLGQFFGSNVANDNCVLLRGKGPQKPESTYDIVRLYILLRPNWLQYCLRHKNSFVSLALSLIQNFKLAKSKLMDSTRTMRFIVNYNTDRCLKFFFKIFNLT